MPHSRAHCSTGIALITGLTFLLSIVCLSFVCPVTDATAQETRNVDRYLKRYRRLRMDPVTVASRVRATGEFSLPTDDGEFRLTLVPNDVRAPRYRAEAVGADGVTRPVVPEQLRTFRGTAACPGNCDSNKDGSVNVLDVQLQANIVLGIATCP
jgi:hypothetical protein